MTCTFGASPDTRAQQLPPSSTAWRVYPATRNIVAARWAQMAMLSVLLSFGTAAMHPAVAGGMARGAAAYYKGYRGDYARAARELIPAASRGNIRAQAQLGFMYEYGFGVPQNYAVAADLYQSAAAQGNAFAQSRLGLSYDKGHGVPQSLILSYKWLDLAAARASSREGDYYRRLRDAVASKMSSDQIVQGQRLALIWAPGSW
jgi:TPR repeat protein